MLRFSRYFYGEKWWNNYSSQIDERYKGFLQNFRTQSEIQFSYFDPRNYQSIFE